MKSNPILQEIWDIKDRLAAEAGLRCGPPNIPTPARWCVTPRSYGNFIAEQERQRKEQSALTLNEEPPK